MRVIYGQTKISYTDRCTHALVKCLQNGLAYFASAVSNKCKMFIKEVPGGQGARGRAGPDPLGRSVVDAEEPFSLSLKLRRNKLECLSLKIIYGFFDICE
jgi:hypothetical protein